MPLNLTQYIEGIPNHVTENRKRFSQWIKDNNIVIGFYKQDEKQYTYYDKKFYNLVNVIESYIGKQNYQIFKDIDDGLTYADTHNASVLMIFSIGTALDGFQFFETLTEYNGYSVVGHIVKKLKWNKDQQHYNLHPQGFIIDINDWRAVGKTSYNASLNKGEEIYNIDASKNTVYDHDPDVFLPLSIKKGTGTVTAIREFDLGTRLINDLIKYDYKLAAFHHGTRKFKIFFGGGEENVDEYLNKYFKKVYKYPLDPLHNNYKIQKLYSNIEKSPDINQIKNLVSCALPISIVHKKIIFPNLENFLIVDLSENQLKFCKKIFDKWNGDINQYIDMAGDYEQLNFKNDFLLNWNYDKNTVADALESINANVTYCNEDILAYNCPNAIFSVSNCFDYLPNVYNYGAETDARYVDFLKSRDFLITASDTVYF